MGCRVRGFWVLLLGFVAWVCWFMGLPLGSWVRRLGLWFLFSVFWSLVFTVSSTMIVVDFYFYFFLFFYFSRCHGFYFLFFIFYRGIRGRRRDWGVSPTMVVIDFRGRRGRRRLRFLGVSFLESECLILEFHVNVNINRDCDTWFATVNSNPSASGC